MEDVEGDDVPRLSTSIGEFDRVLGGGIVPGSLILLGGDPGIGKSTLMMQLALQLKDSVTLYITGEESVRQIKLRAERLETKAAKNILLSPLHFDTGLCSIIWRPVFHSKDIVHTVGDIIKRQAT